jgi:hypothetical protein
MLLLGVLILPQEETMERLLSMSQLETASRDLTIQKMKKSRSSHVLHLMPLERHALLEISIDSMFTTSIRKDLNGMKFAAKS